jgi:hypothetical protein
MIYSPFALISWNFSVSGRKFVIVIADLWGSVDCFFLDQGNTGGVGGTGEVGIAFPVFLRTWAQYGGDWAVKLLTIETF